MTAHAEELATIAESVRQMLQASEDTAEQWQILVDNGFASLASDDSVDIPVPSLLTTVAAETGRALSGAPFLASAVIGAGVTSKLDAAQGEQFALSLEKGEGAVLALPLGHSPWDVLPRIVQESSADEARLEGSFLRVLGAAQASTLLVPQSEGLYAVDLNSAGVVVSPVDSPDPSRPLADVTLTGASARLVADAVTAEAALRNGFTLGLLSLSAEMVATAQDMLERTIEYVAQRRAFGRPVGQFQSVKHSTVDLYTEITHARALLKDATGRAEANGTDRSALEAAALAKIQAGKALDLVATRAVLLHGAIGFTWELGAHFVARRNMTDRFLLGSEASLVDAVAASLLEAEPTGEPGSADASADWLAAHAPSMVGPRDHVGHFAVLTPDEAADQLQRARAWERLKSEAGFAGIAVPTELGGQGRSQFEALSFQALEHGYELPHWIFAITHGMILPTMLQWGTPEQQQKFVPSMLNGEGLWCQLFSEPDAGSDLAMASTKATKVEGGWRIDGQKVWNSGADNADFGLLVARTDPDVPKHKGLTVFTVPMDAPGLTVRPIIQASGSALFCETFFDGVFIPDSDVVGGVGNGWRVAITTLMNERLALTGDGVPFAGAIAEARTRAAGLSEQLRSQMVEIHSYQRALHALSAEVRDGIRSGHEPGPEGSVNKLITGRSALAVADFVSRLLGPELLVDRDWNEYVLGAVGLLIGGGTEEIQKNVIAERVLGLPPEPRDAVKVSWAEERAGGKGQGGTGAR